MSTELWIVDLIPMELECPEPLFDGLFGDGRNELIEPNEVRVSDGVEAFDEDKEEGIDCSLVFRIVLVGVEFFFRT